MHPVWGYLIVLILVILVGPVNNVKAMLAIGLAPAMPIIERQEIDEAMQWGAGMQQRGVQLMVRRLWRWMWYKIKRGLECIISIP